MTKLQKQRLLAIAKDVLKNMKYYRIERGAFCELSPPLPKEAEGKQLQKFIPELKKRKQCRVCADGALFLSAVTLYNAFKVDFGLTEPLYLTEPPYSAGVDNETLLDFLRTKIGAKQVEYIETAFEQGDGYHDTDYNDPTSKAAGDFGRRYSSSTNRLRAILKNIIKNKGEFKPEQK
jgi:hypothetical protein